MGAIESWLRERFSRVRLFFSNLHDYQKTAEQFMFDNPFSALFLDTGLGKTGACLKLIHRLVMDGLDSPVLVIGPIRVVTVTWPDELYDWEFACPLSYKVIRDDDLVDAINAAGKDARRLAKLNNVDEETMKKAVATARLRTSQRLVRQLYARERQTIHLINQEQVEFLVEAWGRDWPYKVVIIDESSSLKDHKTNRWKALWKVRPLIKRMHQLTATPASESYTHLFAQITLLDRGERFGRSFTDFAKKYFEHNQYSRKYTLREGAKEAITELISDICIVMKQEDYLDLQQPVPVYHQVALSDEQLALYREMENEFVVTLPEGDVVEAASAAALSQKLLQMASGVLYDTFEEETQNGDIVERRVVHHLHDAKIEALRQLREELGGENVLVAYYHQSSLDRLLKAFPDAQAMDKAGKLIGKWNSGKVPMLLLHPQSDAHGLNLQRGGRHVVFFDMIWSYERYYQFYRRLARQGQKYVVVIHHLIARGTKDELVAECLRDKCDAQEALFKAITNLRRKLQRARMKRLLLQNLNLQQEVDNEDDEL